MKPQIACIVLAWLFFAHAPSHASAQSPTHQLTRQQLESALHLGTQFLVRNQRSAGNFFYEYDWRRRTDSDEDNPARQAGALWGLTTVYQMTPTDQVRQAIERGLAFMIQHSRTSEDGLRYLVYPGAKVGSTGAVALVALAHLDFLSSHSTTDVADATHRNHLDEYLRFLDSMRRPDGLCYAYYDHLSGKPLGGRSPYADGEALLLWVKAAKQPRYGPFRMAARRAAISGFERHVKAARQENPDSEATKAFYQWSSMAFYEIATSDWGEADEFGDYLIELADWMIDVHETLQRKRNTAYAYEGLIPAYALARLRQDNAHVDKIGQVIEAGLGKLLRWQVGSSTANNFVRRAPSTDQRARGGVQNHARESQLRIDVTQHQTHAVILALRHFLPADELSKSAAD